MRNQLECFVPPTTFTCSELINIGEHRPCPTGLRLRRSKFSPTEIPTSVKPGVGPSSLQHMCIVLGKGIREDEAGIVAVPTEAHDPVEEDGLMYRKTLKNSSGS